MRAGRPLAFISLALLALCCAGCELTELTPSRSASGEVFTIRGRNFGSTQGSSIPSINRGRAYALEVLSWSPTAIRVRIPSGLPAGMYKVLVYADSSYRYSSNSLDFWVTAAPVPSTITDPYEAQVRSFRIRYGKSVEWERWMLANRDRYERAFLNQHAAPSCLHVSFRYETTPVRYSPPWSSEAEHMSAYEAMAEACYPGYDFRFIFGGDPAASYANVIAGIAENASHATGNDIYLYHETIFDHEFAHVMGIRHHYDDVSEAAHGNHMPPGESRCLMDRSGNQFCSACRTALNIPLDIDNEAAINAALHRLGDRETRP